MGDGAEGWKRREIPSNWQPVHLFRPMSLQEKASQDQVFAVCPVYRAFLAITRSMAIAGISPLLIPRYRRVFRGNWPRIRPAPRLLFVIEIDNLIAVDTSQYAVSFGST